MRLVLDTCVCIDLFRGGCLPIVKNLGYELLVPDVLQLELKEPPWDSLLRSGINPISLSPVEIAKIYSLRSQYPRPSINDLFSFAVAERENGLLITGDRNLRLAAEAEGIIVHGVLWLLDEMVRAKLLSNRQALSSMNEMLKFNSRFPSAEIQKRNRAWS
jgi:hypothetical protein